ncbi:MAG: hypothetical protein ABI481_08490 [Pyrinomonadaceae bacterium]
MLAVGVMPATAAKRAETMRVQINKEKRVAKGKVSIHFTELIEDSRCPTDTNCVWAGNAKIKIRVTGYGRSQDLTMDTNGPHQGANAEGYSIKLVSLTPAPRSNIRINRNGYVATFEVSKLTR